MNKVRIIILIVAVSLVLVGGAVFGIIVAKNGFANVNGKMEENTHELTTDFDKINIDVDLSDIEIIVSDEKKVVCREIEELKHSVEVVDGTLFIKQENNLKWYARIGFFGSIKSSVTIYMPAKTFESIQVKGATGDYTVNGAYMFNNAYIKLSTGDVTSSANYGEAVITVSTGKVNVNDCTVNKLGLSTSTGDINLKNVVVSDTLVTDSDTGDLTAQNVQVGNEIIAIADTGKFRLTNVTSKDIYLETTTGKKILTSVIASGKMVIKASTGDVKFDKCDAAEITVKTSTGDVTGSFLTDKVFYASSSTSTPNVPKSTTGGLCDVTTSTGDIKLWIDSGE